MKKIISLLLSIIFLLSFAPLNIFAMSGNGTEGNPYLVSSASDINNIHNDLSGYYKLTCNIDMSGVDFEPIGNENEGAFTGTIDGNGYTVKNLNINLPDNKYVGFVGYLEGTVKNLNLENVDAYGYRYVGGIVGYVCDGEISNCKSSGLVNGNYKLINIYVGGIAGYNNGLFNDCSNNSTVEVSNEQNNIGGNYYIGGITGYNTGEISSCQNNKAVYTTVSGVFAGGICGKNLGNINNCCNYSFTCCAGIAYNNEGTIEFCENYGNIVSNSSSGGIAVNNVGYIKSCLNTGTIECDSSNSGHSSGGIVSFNGSDRKKGYIYECLNSGKIIAKTDYYDIYAGGIAGDNYYNSTTNGQYGIIRDCFNSGIIYTHGNKKTNWGHASYACGISHNTNQYNDNVFNCLNVGEQKSYTGPNKNMAYSCSVSRRSNNSYYLINTAKTQENDAKMIFYNQIKNLTLTDLELSHRKWIINSKVNNGLPIPIELPKHIDLNKCVIVMSEDEIEQLSAYVDNISEFVSWTSDDSSIATISTTGIVTPCSVGSCTITATNTYGMKANCLVYVYRKATSMHLSKEELNVNESGCYNNLTAIQNPVGANETLTWHSENENIATVNQNGVVYGKSKGTTKIYAVTTQSNIRAECTVTVSAPISSIKLSSENKTLKLGASDVITATISPADYEGDIVWESSDDSIVSVDSDGIIQANKIGTAYITATATSGVSAQCKVTVNQPATGIKLNKSEITTYVGSTYQLSSSVLPLDTTDSVSWESSNSSYATVSSTGLVTGVRPGSTSITARTSNGLTATCNVTIKEAIVEPTSVTLSDTYITLAPEDAKAITATIAPSNATETNLVWTSSDENVAAVNNKGVVTAVSNGYATITAKTTNGYSHQCTVKVVDVTKQAFIAKSTKASAGEIAEYTVSVVKNPGMSSFKLNLDYDSSLLTPIEIVKNPQIFGSLSSNLKDEERTSLNVMWYSSDDYIDNADLFTVKFRVADDVEYGTEIPVTMSSGTSDIKNSSGKKLAFFMNNTSVKVEKPLLGDILEDGEIDFRDLNLLARNVSGLESLSQRQLLAADTEQDKVIDTKDTVRLLQHLTGWTGADLIYTFAMNNGVASVKVGSVSINAANEAEIPVIIENNPGVAGFRFELDYDKNALDILNITPDAFISENFMTNLGTDEKLYVSWYNAENISADGTLFTIKVKYKDGSDKQTTPISIVAADNNMCNQKREDVIAEYETGYLMTDSFVKENESIENGTYSAELYFDNSYEEKSAVAILALYDKSGKLITLSSKDITVKPGKENISVTLEAAEFDNFKLFIWDSLENLKPIVTVK